MARLFPEKTVNRLEHTVDYLSFEIPIHFQFWVKAFYFFWLMGWMLGELFSYDILMRGLEDEVVASKLLFHYVHFIFWSSAGPLSFYFVIVRKPGKEWITLSDGELEYSRSSYQYSVSNRFDLASIENLRVQIPDTGLSQRYHRGAMEGSIAFDYEGHVYHFGMNLSSKESRKLVQDIRQFASGEGIYL